MISLGVVLLLLGWFLVIPPLYTIGGILLICGLVAWLLGATGHPIAGRRWYY